MPHRPLSPFSLMIGVLGISQGFNPVLATETLSSAVSGQIHYPASSLEDLLTRGQQWYDQGLLQEAWDTWNQALGIATTPEVTIVTLNALATVAQDLGYWDAAAAHLNQAQTLLDASPQPNLQAKIWNTRGNFAFRQGQIQEALQFWQQGSVLYQSLGDSEGYVLSQINEIYALQALGFYDRARKQLDHLQQRIAQLPVGSVQVRAMQSMGEILKRFGRYEEATIVLDQAFDLASLVGLKLLAAEIILDQGTLYAALGERESPAQFREQQIREQQSREQPTSREKALDYFARVQELNAPPQLQIEAHLHQFQLLLALNRPAQALDLWATLQPQLVQLSPSRFSVSAKINVAHSLMQGWESSAISSPLRPFRWPTSLDIAQLLRDAIQDARLLGDPRLQSFALGQLGHLYEFNQQYPEALDLTEEALVLAQSIHAEDAIALWQWQTGRIHKAQGNTDTALIAYQEAVKTLQTLRQDLVATTTEAQFSFRSSVEPVYRELTALLLDNLEQYSPPEQQTRLQQAREAIESLQLAELENFFREACLNFETKPIDAIDPSAAVLYPIILKDRVEVIVSLPDQSLQHFRYDIPETQRNRVLQELRKSFNPALPASRVLPLGATVYDWLIRPLDSTLEAQGVKTIVFVLDSALRNIPMGVLNDGEQFLMEKYNLVVAPGLKLLRSDSSIHATKVENLKVLLGGLSDSRNNFPPLPNVEVELTELATVFPAHSILLNEHFTQQSVTNELRDYPATIIHLATHGQFSSDAEKTFLLAWDGQINVRTLDQVLKERITTSPIELLVLSACQTAQGDEQAILGLAGMAVRSGAHTTLGTLWSINDRSTAELMIHFYQNLASGQGKAEALRNAQLAFLHSEAYAHPYYWAPFVLVGEWE